MKIETELKKLDAFYQNKEYQKIEPFLVEKIAEAKECESYDAYLAFSNELIGFYRSISEHDQSLVIAEDVLLLMEELGMEETVHFGTSLLNAATAYRAAGKNREALGYYERALVLYEKTLEQEDYRFASLYNNISILLSQMGEIKKAILFLDNAISVISKIMPGSVELASSFTNKALLLFQTSQRNEAMALLEEALLIFEKEKNKNDPHYSAALAGVGEAYYHLGDFPKSVQAYEKSIHMIEQVYGKNESYCIVCYNCSVVCHEAGMTEKEVFYKKEAEGMI